MPRYTKTALGSGFNKASFDQNFDDIVTAINSLLARDDSTSNEMDIPLDMNSQRIINVLDPSVDQDVATKAYVDGLGLSPVPGAQTISHESIVATNLQTVFPTTEAYVPGSGDLAVYQEGLRLAPIDDYTETTTNSFTLETGATTDDVIDVFIGTNTTIVQTASEVTYVDSGLVASDVETSLRWIDDHIREYDVTRSPYSADKTGVVDATTAIQAAITAAVVTGGEVFIPRGVYKISSQLDLDISGITGAPDNQQRRVNIRGEGKGNTVLLASTNDSFTILKVTGGTSTDRFAYCTISDIAFGGDTPTDRTATGLELEDVAYMSVVETTFHDLDVCLLLDGALSNNFSGLVFNESATGIVAEKSTSSPHANIYTGCEFRQLSNLAYDGASGAGIGTSQSVFIGCQFEGCGTHASSGTGGLDFVLTGSAGEVGPSFFGCYFEVNGGGFDVKVAESGTRRITVPFYACNFNRVKSTKFVTNNIVATGEVDLNLNGCTFTSYNTYTPSAGRPYLNLATTVRLRDVGNRWGDAVEGPTIDQGLPYAGYVDGSAGAGVAGTLPNGWSVAQTSTGVFTITHNLGHTDYSFVATIDSTTAALLQRSVVQTNTVIVKLTDTSHVESDEDFSFMLVELKPVA